MISKQTVQDLKLFINNIKVFEKGFHTLLIDYLSVTEENKKLKETLETALTEIADHARMVEELEREIEQLKTVN